VIPSTEATGTSAAAREAGRAPVFVADFAPAGADLAAGAGGVAASETAEAKSSEHRAREDLSFMDGTSYRSIYEPRS
jgi:hypothetical protein